VSDVAELLDAARRDDRRALGRLLTIAERDGDDAEVLAELLLADPNPPAHVVGITGAPGAGKSTLTGRMIAAGTAAGRRVAVLAVDPSSPFSGGAILGDRIRMDPVVESAPDRCFIRSLATRGHLGGLATAVPPMIRVLAAAGYGLVIVETVGVGQAELDIASLADTTIVVVTPGWGDAIQANKAGLLEIADVFAVNKADRPGASDAVRDLEHMLDLAPASAWRPPVCCTVATQGDGVDELVRAVEAHRDHLEASDARRARRAARDRSEVRARVEHELMALADARLESALVDEAHDDVPTTPRAIARRVVSTIVDSGERWSDRQAHQTP
jgi:LAO/AO transport system kinase